MSVRPNNTRRRVANRSSLRRVVGRRRPPPPSSSSASSHASSKTDENTVQNANLYTTAREYYDGETRAGREPLVAPVPYKVFLDDTDRTKFEYRDEDYAEYLERLQDAIVTRQDENAETTISDYSMSSVAKLPIKKYGSRIDIAQAQSETVWDFNIMEDVPIAKIVNGDPDYADYLLFIFIDETTKIPTYFVTTKESLEYALKKRDNIFYKCTGKDSNRHDTQSPAYFTLTSFTTLTQSFLLVSQLKTILTEGGTDKRIFVLRRNTRIRDFRYAITDMIVYGRVPSYVGRTHCNELDDAPFYKIYDLFYWAPSAPAAEARASKRKRTSSVSSSSSSKSGTRKRRKSGHSKVSSRIK